MIDVIALIGPASARWEDLVGGVTSTVGGALDRDRADFTMLLSRSGGKPSITSLKSSFSEILISFSSLRFSSAMPRSESPSRLTASARRALAMLAKGFATEKIMSDHGFSRRLLTGLVSTGLAMLHSEPVGDSPAEVTYIMITAAGRQALDRPRLEHRRRRVMTRRLAKALGKSR